jgi:hypothetical protein
MPTNAAEDAAIEADEVPEEAPDAEPIPLLT